MHKMDRMKTKYRFMSTVFCRIHGRERLPIWPYGLCQREPKEPGLYKKHTATQLVMPKMRLEPLNVCLTDRRLNQLS